jgi:hypothetical protein
MYKFKQFMLQAQKQKKCPTGYRFDKKLQVCVPVGVSRYYPYLGGTRGNGNTSSQDNQSSNGNGNGDSSNGTSNGTNGNGSNGNGGGE